MPKKLDSVIADLYEESVWARRMCDYDQANFLYAKLRRDHGIELFYEIELRKPYRFVHPIGTVLGRAHYSPHMVFYQNCGIGSDLDGNKPVFYGPCVLFPGARVLGGAVVGCNVFITAGTVVSATAKRPVNIQDNSVVFPQVQPDGTMGFGTRPTKRNVVERFFETPEKIKVS